MLDIVHLNLSQDAPGVVLLDGGTGSELRRRGVELSPAAWTATANLTHPETVRQIHVDFIAAGADVITTNSFAATRFVLDSAGIGGRQAQVVANAVAAALGARDAVGRQVAIAGSISCLPPAMGRAGYPKPTAELDAYRQLALRLAEGGVDLLLLEMLQAPAHAERACRAAKETGLPFWAGISCRLAPPPQGQPDAQAGLVNYDAPHNPVDDLVATITGFEPAAICVMHSPIDAIDIALACIAGASAAPIGAYAEIPYREGPVADCDPAAQVTPVRYADAALGWQAAGAKILGGCCGTTPAHIAAIAAHLRR